MCTMNLTVNNNQVFRKVQMEVLKTPSGSRTTGRAEKDAIYMLSIYYRAVGSSLLIVFLHALPESI